MVVRGPRRYDIHLTLIESILRHSVGIGREMKQENKTGQLDPNEVGLPWLEGKRLEVSAGLVRAAEVAAYHGPRT